METDTAAPEKTTDPRTASPLIKAGGNVAFLIYLPAESDPLVVARDRKEVEKFATNHLITAIKEKTKINIKLSSASDPRGASDLISHHWRRILEGDDTAGHILRTEYHGTTTIPGCDIKLIIRPIAEVDSK